MSVVTSRVAAATDALVALAVTYFQADADAAVVDGPPSGADGQTASMHKRLYIGCDDADPEADETLAADAQQSNRTIGMRQRREELTIHCVAEGWDGNASMKAARDNANAMLAAVENILRPTPTQLTAETVSNTVMWAEVTVSAMTQAQKANGSYCRINFTVSAVAQLNGT